MCSQSIMTMSVMELSTEGDGKYQRMKNSWMKGTESNWRELQGCQLLIGCLEQPLSGLNLIESSIRDDSTKEMDRTLHSGKRLFKHLISKILPCLFYV